MFTTNQFHSIYTFTALTSAHADSKVLQPYRPQSLITVGIAEVITNKDARKETRQRGVGERPCRKSGLTPIVSQIVATCIIKQLFH